MNNETSIQTLPEPIKESKSYKSFAEYSTEITGQHMKNSVLEISRDGNSANLNIEIWLSTELREKMLNTESPIYYTFGDVIGSDKIGNLLIESPPVIQFKSSMIEETYILSQEIKFKKELSSEEEKELLSPENYQLQFLNEEKFPVYVIIGLDLSTIN
ncbi:hypothetical protein NDK47_05435 [Brevibacillus ruminantium]|uniref:Uncharacterized protein n=1 Tax=Brevibacillus ruminantium TaxID=2950604 RepID=A0ABY4WHW5_9BACL|nr:hypothetical protein [Brevibacillus ruminantium]USG66741.1 hypothetical protein NDK47_05435 [Brevibacillus ruminantium]